MSDAPHPLPADQAPAPTLDSFAAPLTALVVGASGGIGAALTQELAACDRVSRVHALSRTGAVPQGPKISPGQIDLEDEDSIALAAETLKQAGEVPSLVIVAAGILHDPNTGLGPEKSHRALSLASFERVHRINCFGPALVAKHLLPLFARKERAVFAALSARVGSISDNRLGGWYAYRASKAALNQVLRCLAIEQARKSPQHVILGLHPGTVASDLSGPFQGHVAEGKLFSPGYAARHLLAVVNNATPDHSGELHAWDGQRVPA